MQETYYHLWIYTNILNTTWFVWIIVIAVLGANLFAPILLWFIFRGKRVFGQKGVVPKSLHSLWKKKTKAG